MGLTATTHARFHPLGPLLELLLYVARGGRASQMTASALAQPVDQPEAAVAEVLDGKNDLHVVLLGRLLEAADAHQLLHVLLLLAHVDVVRQLLDLLQIVAAARVDRGCRLDQGREQQRVRGAEWLGHRVLLLLFAVLVYAVHEGFLLLMHFLHQLVILREEERVEQGALDHAYLLGIAQRLLEEQ